MGRDLSNPWQGRIETSLIEVGLGYEICQRPCRAHKHVVGNQSCAARDRAKANAREDIRVVTLAWHQRMPTLLPCSERAAACEQRTSIGVAIRLLGRALLLLGRIRAPKNDRPRV